MHPPAVTPGPTALRPRWYELPPDIRRVIETQAGSKVVKATSQGAGLTPGFASRLRFADGQRLFVKAADDATRAMFASAYRKEAQVLPMLPRQVPAPRIQWSYDADGWIVLALDDIDGRHPRRPWERKELGVVLDVIARTSRALTPAPGAIGAPEFEAEHGALVDGWDTLAHLPHAGEAAALARHGLAAAAGVALVHTDVRDDNLLLDQSGSVWVCDWNWVCRGAAWVDSLMVLISAHGDGLDADEAVGTYELTRDVDGDDIDGLLALLTGYFFNAASQEAPDTSPHLRNHQRWYAGVAWDWLQRRRHWRTDLRPHAPRW